MCTQSRLNEILDRTVAEAKEIFGPAFHGAILYGSFARGDYDDESDVEMQYQRAEKLVAEIAAYLSGKDKAAQ